MKGVKRQFNTGDIIVESADLWKYGKSGLVSKGMNKSTSGNASTNVGRESPFPMPMYKYYCLGHSSRRYCTRELVKALT